MKLKTNFKSKRKEQRKTIKDTIIQTAKRCSTKQSWGNAYKIVITTIKAITSKAPTCPVMMENIVLDLSLNMKL